MRNLTGSLTALTLVVASCLSTAAAQTHAPGAVKRPPPPGLTPRGGPDFVVLKNGDDHLGQLLVTAFRIRAEWGEVVLAKQAVAQIVFGRNASAPDVVTTSDGDRISGKLEGRYVQISRTAYAPLDVSLADIAQVTLTPRPEQLLRASPPFALGLRNGDALRVDVTNRQLTLQTDKGTFALPLRELRLLDVEVMDDGAHARALLRPGDRQVQGRLLERDLALMTRAGQVLQVPWRHVAHLAGFVPLQITSVDFVGEPAFAPDVRIAPGMRDRLRSGGLGPEMVALPAGRFRRGDLHADGDADELPAREVQIARPFALSRYPVTFDDYDLFCERTHQPKPSDEGWGRGRRPVVNVSWYDAAAYAEWLSEQSGRRYRLPSNAEFEYAARGGLETRYPWGNEPNRGLAACAGCGSLWDSTRAAPVGRFPPNGFGLYDMAGNVWQWVQDCWDADYKSSPVDGRPYTKGEYCDKKVVRGGAWSTPLRELRSANRWRDFTIRPSDDTGFRVAREVD